MISYEKIMAMNPTSYEKMTNSLGQEIDFLEHPTKGDTAEVLVCCHELKLMAYSGFMETDDMKASHKEYEPTFQDGKLFIGEFED